MAHLFGECLDKKYITNDIKTDCRYKIVFSLYFYGGEKFENKSYWDAKEYFEEVLKFLNENWKVKDWFGSRINDLKKKLGETYYEIAKEKWSNYDTYPIETSIEYFKKASYYNVGSSRGYELYYYLYKAFYESKYNRTANLDMARKFEDQPLRRGKKIFF